MKNKKLNWLAVPCAAIVVITATVSAQAAPTHMRTGRRGSPITAGYRRPAPVRPISFGRTHYSTGRFWTGFGVGLLGGMVVDSVIASRPTTVVSYPQVVVTPTPIVVTPQPQTVVASSSGYYVDQLQRVWVEGQWIDSVNGYGQRVRVWQEGHYEDRNIRVWTEL